MQNILEILRTEHKTEHNFYKVKKQYVLPKIYHGGENFDLSKRWYVYFSYRDPHTGKMVRQRNIYMNVNANFNTKKERLAELRLIKSKLTELLIAGYSPYQHPKTKDRYVIKDALNFAFDLKVKTLAESTIPEYKSRLNSFIKYLDHNILSNTYADEFKRKDIIEYLNGILKDKSAKTRNNHRLVLQSLFKVLKDNDIISENIVEGISIEKTKSVRHKTYSDSQLNKILNYISEKDRELLLFIRFISYNFLRPIEVVRLRYSDLKLTEIKPYLEVRAKNKLLKTKIIPAILLDDIKSLKVSGDDFIFKTNDKGIETNEINKRNYFSKKFTRIKKELKLGSEYTMYSFRHTFITKLYREIRKTKTPFETKSELMLITGHSTMDALEKYLRDIDAELPEDYSHLLV